LRMFVNLSPKRRKRAPQRSPPIPSEAHPADPSEAPPATAVPTAIGHAAGGSSPCQPVGVSRGCFGGRRGLGTGPNGHAAGGQFALPAGRR
jgi:hypothetical protein